MKKLRFLVLLVLLTGLSIQPASAQSFREAEASADALGGFGAAVAVADGEVLVGEAMNNSTSGMVYVYRREGAGWVEKEVITASNAAEGDHFGQAIALNGSLMLVGAPAQYDNRGAVYVFRKQDGQWLEQARLTDANGTSGDMLGRSLSLEGDVALVGAPNKNADAGAAYLYQRNAQGMWKEVGRLEGEGVEEGDAFGESVLLMGDTAFVGAPRHNSGTGTVFIFNRDTDGTWAAAGTLPLTGLSSNDRFGTALLQAGEAVLASAPMHDRGSGAVFVFQPNEDGTWSASDRLSAFDGRPGRRFGSALGYDGEAVWAGALGGLYVITRDAAGTGWGGVEKVTPGQEGRFMPGAVDVRDGVAVIGSASADMGAGSAMIFEKEANGAWVSRETVVSEVKNYAAVTGGKVSCTDGAASAFDCKQMDLVAFLPVQAIGGGRGVRVNDVWGWADADTGKEYALVGRMDGLAFVDISDPYNPRYLGNLARTEGAPMSVWRDVKTYKNHAFIVADGAGAHGMQVFDLTQLRTVQNAPAEFKETVHYDKIFSAHNIVINEETGYAYAVGASSGGETCGGGLHMINIQDPKSPTFAGCFADPSTGRASTGYSHDAQCVVYKGPDQEHQGKEICLGANETALSIADVTDKANPIPLASASYPNVGYTHQGWLTEDHRYFYMNDELDEIGGNVTHTRTLIWDLEDLDDPQLIKEHYSEISASDHNLYIRGNLMYQSNYVGGLRVLDITDPANPVETGYFDTVPYGENTPGFSGSWSNFPFFKSGVIVVTSGNEGMFLLKKNEVDI